MLCFVIDGRQHLVNMTFFGDSTRWAGHNALAAVYAGDFVLQWQRIIAIDTHDVLAGLHALAAEDALLIIPLNGWIVLADGHAALQIYREVTLALILVWYPALGT